MPSILFVTTVDITLEAFLMPFAAHLRAQGWTVDALSNGAVTNANLEDVFDSRFDIAWSRNPLSPGNIFAGARRVRDVVDAGAYDIVWVHTPIAAWVTRFALRNRSSATRPAVIYTAHGFHFHAGQHPLKNFVFRTMELTAAPWTDMLVTINAQDFEAVRLLRIPVERRRMIPGIGVDTVAFDPAHVSADSRGATRRELGADADTVLLTMIAEFSANKRHGLALDALSRVRAPHVRLALVGSGPLEAAVREHAEKLGLGDRVVFTGYRRDIPEILAASDALLLCSRREGLNRSALEAMASGVPVIGTPTRGIADAIGGEEAGWTAASDSPDDLAAVIEAAATDSAERARRGEAARAKAVREFSLDSVLGSYETLFTEVLDSRECDMVEPDETSL